MSGTFRTFNSIFVAFISNFIFDLGLATNVEYAKKTAQSLVDSTVYAPFLAVLALVNVIDIPIQLYTKQISDKRLMLLYNVIYPFQRGNNAEPLYLFWGSTSTSNKLDHFVPLLDESDFELMGNIVVNSKVQVEPFYLEFLEKNVCSVWS